MKGNKHSKLASLKDVKTNAKVTNEGKGFKSLLAKILVLVGGPVFLSFIVVGIITLMLVKSNTIDQSNEILKAKSQSAAHEIENFLLQYESISEKMSQNAALQELMADSSKTRPMETHKNYRIIEKTMKTMVKDDNNILSLFIADIDAGQSINSNGGNNKQYNVEERPWFIEMKAKNGLTLTEPYEDLNTKQQVITIAMPIYQEGTNNIIGAVGLDLLLGELGNTIAGYQLGETGYFTLSTGVGQLLYHPNEEWVNTNITSADVSQNIRQALLEKREGSISYTSGSKKVHGYVSAIGDTGWTVASGLPDQEFYQEYTNMLASLLAAFIAVVIIILIAIWVVARGIISPLKKLTNTANEIAEGRLDISAEVSTRDEVGQMATAINRTVVQLNQYVSYIQEVTDVLGHMAQGDMRINLKQDYVGQFAPIKEALLNISASLNRVLSTIQVAAEQVNAGAGQVSSGSQALASGATEQAATVEELTASITTVAQQAENNAENVRQATQYVAEAAEGTKESNQHMQELTVAMQDIRESSEKISNITKVIEDIAFQTNILALNAAIEAARAGSAGKGFAVVADEVRNLAAKSAEAAQQTATLIEHAYGTVAEGDKITEETAKLLQSVEEKAKMVSEAIHSVEVASSEQANAIEQIQQGISQVSAVVQENAATAEESSASSEELSAQANMLRAEVAMFKLDNQQTVQNITDIKDEKFNIEEEDSIEFEVQANAKY